MRAALVATILMSVVLPVPAAYAATNAPSGNSGLSQYLEVVPGAGGDRPSTPIKNVKASASVSENGQSGQQAASSGAETATNEAPAGGSDTRKLSRSERLLHRFVDYSTPATSRAELGDSATSPSRLGAIAGTMAGDDDGAGMSRWLPLLLIGSAIAAICFAAGRRTGRRQS